MSSEQDAYRTLRTLRETIEARVREQIQRHLSISPHSDPQKILELQIGQEREELLKMQQKLEEQEKYEAADAIEMLADEWLPELTNMLRSKLR